MVKAASGRMVRIPVDELASWQKAQDEIRAGTYKPNMKLREELAKKIKGEK
jgi:hypothetical protein